MLVTLVDYLISPLPAMQLTDGEDLRNTVLNAPIGICILDADTFVAGIVNDKFLEVAGKPYEAIYGKFYWEPFAEARIYYEAALEGVVKTGEAYYANEVELMLIRHGQEENIFVTFVYAPVKDAAGKVKKVAVWVLENTKQVAERQKVEASRTAFQHERDRLKSFFMQAPAGICILDGPELIFEMVNPAYQELLPGRQLLGRSIFEALPELVGTPVQENLLKVYNTGQTFEIKESLVAVAEYEGGPTHDRYFSFTFQARRDENDKVDGILNFVFEVTDLVTTQHELTEARDQAEQQKRIYETIASGTPDLMYVFGLDYRFTYVNDALLSMWGKTLENAVGKSLLENGYEPWHAEMHEREIDQVKATKQPIRGEVAFPHATLGRRVYDYILTPVLNEQGEVEAVAGTTRDVTERKEWETALADSSEELQASNEELAATNEELATGQDELQKLVNRLEESEHQTRAIVENAPFPIGVYIGRELRIAFANQSIIDVFGKGPDVIGKLYTEVLPELDNQAVFTQLDEVYTTGKAFHARNQRIDLVVDGRMKTSYFNYSFTALRDQDGNIYGVMNTAADVTDVVLAKQEVERTSYNLATLNEELAETNEQLRSANEELAAVNEELATTNDELTEMQTTLRQANLSLSESESRFRRLVQEAPGAIFVLKGSDMIIETVNDLMIKMLGKDKDIIGKPFFEAIPELVDQPFFGLLNGVYASGETYYGNEVKGTVEVDGQPTDGYFNFIYQPLKDDDGQVTGIMCMAIDVVEQVKARKAIERAEESLRMAIDAANLGTYYINVIDRIFYPSAKLKEFFGYGPDEDVPYEAAINQIHPDYRQAVADRVEAAITQGATFEMEYPIIAHNDGRIRWVKAIGTVQQDDNGVNRYFTGVLHEITEQKQDEIRKNDFIGMVSHELKTPLTSLNAIIQMSNLKLKNSGDPFLAGAMGRANQQVKRMTAMINGFLNISRLESGKILIEKQAFDMDHLLREMIDESRLTVTTHRIEFDSCGQIEVYADRDKISSVISNLLGNAVKYSPKGKVVTVKCMAKDKSVEVSVTDEGMGIKQPDLEKVFDRYYRVETSHTQHISGFGIGLYLSAEIIQRHDGNIWAESESGVGSSFYFSLPLK